MADTYYVDASQPNDDGDGLSEENAWKTINKVQATLTSNQAGTIVKFKCGEEWREQYDVDGYGASGNQFVHTYYGSGDKPKIYGSENVTGWTQDNGNRWKATLTSTPDVIWKDGLRMDLDPEASSGDVDAAEEWYYDSVGDLLYIYSTSDPDGNHEIEAGIRTHCIAGSYENYVKIDGFELLYSQAQGVKISESDGWTVQYCHVHNHGYIEHALAHNIYLENADDCLIAHNESHDAGQHGIYIYSGDNNIIEHNEVYNNHHSNIDIQRYTANTTDGVIIRYNLMYYLDGYYCSGHPTNFFSCGGGSSQKVTNLQIYYNVIYTTHSTKRHSGIHIWQYVDGPVIYNNIYYNTTGAQDGCFAYIENGTLAATVKNNIGVSGNAYPIFRLENSANKTVDYNCWDSVGSGGILTNVGNQGAPGPNYTEAEWSDYQALGFDVNGMNADPKFVDPENYDFHLQSDSPCRDEGVDVSLTPDYDGIAVPQETNPAIGAFEFTGEVADVINLFEDFKERWGKGVHQFHSGGHTLKVYLTNNIPSASLDAIKADLIGITEQNGYAPADIQNEYAETGGIGTLTGVDVTFTASGGSFGPFRYAVLFNDTPADPADPLIGWYDNGYSLTCDTGESFKVDFGVKILDLE